MRPFEYAAPQTEQEALELIGEYRSETAVLAGGTDLIGLMQRELVSPRRVVNLKGIESMRGITTDAASIVIGALTTLEEVAASSLARDYPSLANVIDGIRAVQMQQSGTIGGDLCLMPNCWYYRNGYGLLAMDNSRSLPEAGDNRYHAILGNQGPAKFVSASRFAPSLIAWDGHVRVIGPDPEQAHLIPLESFYQTPRTDRQGLTVLEPGQIVSHIVLPPAGVVHSAAYEVLELEGLDWPLAAAATSMSLENGIVREARIVMGHVAPVPWMARNAAQAIIGHAINERTADMAGAVAVEDATPLSGNEYKVQLAKTAVKRALLRAANQLNLEPSGAVETA